MTSKKYPCTECGAAGRHPHAEWCSIGKARAKAARKNQQARRKTASRRPTPMPVTQTVASGGTSCEQPVAQQINHIALVVDRSGSMGHIHGATIKALNNQIATIKVEAARTGQPTYVSVYHFGDSVRCLFHNKYVHAISEISRREIQISGMTTLMDAVGLSIDDFANQDDVHDSNVSFLVVTLTDGLENASHRYNRRTFVHRMKEMMATDRWTFVFSGPRGCRSDLEYLGVAPGNIQEWDQTEKGVADMASNVNLGMSNFYAGRERGMTKSLDFFTVDMSKVDDSDVSNMLDQTGNFKTLPINNAAPGGVEWVIRNFIEDRLKRNKTFNRQAGGVFTVGYSYYQLTKTEKVQPTKDLLVRDKSNGRVYGGAEARSLIGIPLGVHVKVTPGNVGNYDIFVKSTSVNRKLVRGTDLLYRIR